MTIGPHVDDLGSSETPKVEKVRPFTDVTLSQGNTHCGEHSDMTWNEENNAWTNLPRSLHLEVNIT